MTEDWTARDTPAPSLTKYAIIDDSYTQTRKTCIVRPDGVKLEQITDNNPNSTTYGLLLEDKTWSDENNTTLLASSTVNWTHGNYNSPRPTRTVVTDERGQVTATDFDAYGPYNQVIDRRERGYGGTALLHRIHTEYHNGVEYTGYLINSGTLWYQHPSWGPQWSGPHIFSLPLATEVYANNDTTREARTEYGYDAVPAGQLTDTPGAPQHTSAPDQRGNLTSVKRFANALTLDQATAVVETRGYDICGNVRTLSTSCCEQTTLNYTYATRFAWPTSSTRGSASDSTKQNTTSATIDLNTGLVTDT
jgi:hypothetical protein